MDAELAAGPTMGDSSPVSVRHGKVEKSGVLDTDGMSYARDCSSDGSNTPTGG